MRRKGFFVSNEFKKIPLKKIKKLFFTRVSAFSLLELAITLSIIGVISSFVFPALTTFYKHQKNLRTENHLNQIIQALASYVLSCKHLPSPANPSDPLDGSSDEGRAIGVVPYRALGLPMAIAKDGYDHWITYAVVNELTSANISCVMMPQGNIPESQVFCEIKDPIFPLEVLDSQGMSVLSSQTREDFIAFVLVSHGPKGEGAFDDLGRRRPNSSRDKNINASDNLTFIDRPLSHSKENFFDDKVRWVTRNNVMGVYGQKPCQIREYHNRSVE